MTPEQQDVLTQLRLAVARLEVKVQSIDEKMDSAVVSRAHLEERLAPLTENMNRWKGGLAALVLGAGTVGGAITSAISHFFTGAGVK